MTPGAPSEGEAARSPRGIDPAIFDCDGVHRRRRVHFAGDAPASGAAAARTARGRIFDTLSIDVPCSPLRTVLRGCRRNGWVTFACLLASRDVAQLRLSRNRFLELFRLCRRRDHPLPGEDREMAFGRAWRVHEAGADLAEGRAERSWRARGGCRGSRPGAAFRSRRVPRRPRESASRFRVTITSHLPTMAAAGT